MRKQTIAGLVALAGIAGVAAAQDSISTNGAGDAINPYTFPVQVSYTAEMTELVTSWGNTFGIAPLMKSANGNTTFFNSLISGSALSQDSRQAQSLAGASFQSWSPSDPRGTGVNTANGANLEAGTVAGPANSTQIGVGFADFADSDFGVALNNVFGALVNYAQNDNTLFVRRTTSAVNALDFNDGDFTQFGFGAIDSLGNAMMRADDFMINPGTLGGISGNNIIRVQNTLVGTLNTISGAGFGDAGATSSIVTNSGTNHSAPAMIPALFAGDTDGQAIAGMFGGTIAFGDTGAVTVTSAHRPGTTDHRGTPGWSPAVHFPATVGTASFYVKSGNIGTETDAIQVWGTLADGSISGTCTLNPPASIFDPTTTANITTGVFSNYRGPLFFRGGNGLVATGEDILGNNLTAATNATTGFDDGFGNDPQNAVVVARYADGACADDVEWSVAAWVDGNGGSPIFDGMGNQIGRLTGLFNLTQGSPLGPSITPPAMDAFGNIFFIASAEFTDSEDTLDTALFRAIYDPATFSYRLEVMLRTGDVFTGGNSGVDYQVSFLNLASGGDGGTPTSTMLSSHVNQGGWNGGGADEQAESPANMGGLILTAAITYDSNDDGMFDADMGDERYQSLLFIGNLADEQAPCPADFNGDGMVNVLDVVNFITNWNAQGPGADFNMDGNINVLDVVNFITTWNAGCP